ncbi:MAG: LysM peptidoglycan-binding domain-containing protein [Anaerolineae bacterium]|nr:LysM peptidoglycan-binding domain-containing protein [Anaerolineae bacterium]
MPVISAPRTGPRLAALVAALLLFCAIPSSGVHAQSSGGAVIHVVTWGESLGRIAQQYGVSIQSIVSANGLDSADRIYAGQRLTIPGVSSSSQAGTGSAPSQTHTVQVGENLFRIALRYGLTVESIMSANGLTNPNQLFAGQSLNIPTPGAPAQSPQATPSVESPPAAATPADEAPVEEAEPAPTQPAPASDGEAAEQYTNHVVQRGETLNAISVRYGVFPSAIIQANNISNPSLIFAGMTLRIPGGTGPSSGSSDSNAPAADAAVPGIYVVQRGDTLFRIALRYNLTMSSLMAANGLASADRIYAGQQLRVPGASDVLPPAPAYTAPAPTITTGKQIVVKLSQQMVYAYENGVLQRQFVVSTGLPATPTVTGDYAVYVKYDSTRMVGPGYDLPGVPWTMYFYRGYGFHGTYWHNNFGNPMSHGCVNMRTPEAAWLYEWTPVGTPVHIED